MVGNLNEAINKRLETQYKAFVLACGTTSCGSDERVQTSCKNSTEDNLARYIDISNGIDNMVDELYAVRTETLQVINQVSNSLYRNVLKLRYVYFKPWGYIAHRTGRKIHTVRYKLMDKSIEAATQYIVDLKKMFLTFHTKCGIMIT